MAAGAVTTVTMTLAIETDQQSVVVSADTLDASPEKNGGAIVLKGEDLLCPPMILTSFPLSCKGWPEPMQRRARSFMWTQTPNPKPRPREPGF